MKQVFLIVLTIVALLATWSFLCRYHRIAQQYQETAQIMRRVVLGKERNSDKIPDAWGRNFRFQKNEKNQYTQITSMGSDGVWDTKDDVRGRIDWCPEGYLFTIKWDCFWDSATLLSNEYQSMCEGQH